MGKEKTIIANALGFLQRTELKGIEVDAFIEVINFLNKLNDKENTVVEEDIK